MSACLKYFAVASIDATQQGALASWLRRAETQAASIACRPYEAKAFRAALQAIRPLSCEADPTVFVPQLQALAGAAGVAVVLVQAPTGCRVSGATSLLSSHRDLIALSLRHKTNDHLWLTRPCLWMVSMVWMKSMRPKPIASLRIS